MEKLLSREDPTGIDERLAALRNAHKAIETTQRLTGDASTRTYYRVHYSDGSTAVVMLQPEPGRNLEASFLDVQRFLERLGLSVPKIYLHDPKAGLLVIEDLGDDLLETVVERSKDSRIRDLYVFAVDLLVRMRHRTRGLEPLCGAHRLAFDQQKLMEELHFFMTHFVKGLCRMSPSESAEADLETFFATISSMLASQPRIFTHRDFHSRNLILHRDRLVMIDFQDARMGPAQYDLASLLRDSYVTLPEDLVSELLNYYMHEFPNTDQDQFRYVFDVMSLQRNIKALGTFGYQIYMRHASRYASSIPRTAAYVARNIQQYPEFSVFRAAVEDFICSPATEFQGSWT
ncbi:MAG: phosphotransferase [Deltaproteobacteria bacterium]|nr:phosphotransferase [Deltaproteobacteria bacterium]